MIVAHRTRLFRKDVIPTEATAYRLLRSQPISGVNYYATPWSVHINRNQFSEGDSGHRLSGGFAICQHIRFREIIPLLKTLGVDLLFTPHAEIEQYDITVMPFPHFPVCSGEPRRKQLLYSFVGFNNHPCRTELFSLPKRAETLIQQRDRWHFDMGRFARRRLRREYVQTLTASRFSLCPRGAGPSTVRFWESLRAGAVPVLISDTVRLPEGFDWESCILRVPERNASEADAAIRSIGHAQEQAMRQACLAAHRQFSGANFVSCIRQYYADKIPQKPSGEWRSEPNPGGAASPEQGPVSLAQPKISA